MIQATVGQILINSALPEDLRDYTRILDKDGIKSLFQQIADKYPDKYAEILQRLMKIGGSAANTSGLSISLRHLLPHASRARVVAKLKEENDIDLQDPTISDEERHKRVITRTGQALQKIQDDVFKESEANGSPFAVQVKSGGRGNKSSLNSAIGADLLVTDHFNRVFPIPVYNGFADGLDPVEFWLSSFGTRKNQADAKMAVAGAGFLGKQLAFAAHRSVVTRNRPQEHRVAVGIPVDIADDGNIGAVLAKDAHGFKAGTVITPKVYYSIRDKGGRILVHSPMVAYQDDDGVDQWSAGVRDKGELEPIGSNIGLLSSQALGEPLSQSLLSAKHRASFEGEKAERSGLSYISKAFQGPELFPEHGPLSPESGVVEEVDDAPQGGKYVRINTKKLYIGPQHEVIIKKGMNIEEGDDLTSSPPHPEDLIAHRGIGEARRVYVDHMRKVFEDSGIKVQRRNLESVVSALFNHAKVANPDGFQGHMVDDVIKVNSALASYSPRIGAKKVKAKDATGMYLEEPVLHHTPGTRVSKWMQKDFSEFGVDDLVVHPDPPDFEPVHERALLAMSHDPDWQTQLSGFYIGRSFSKALQRGAESDTKGTSFFPSLAQPETLGS